MSRLTRARLGGRQRRAGGGNAGVMAKRGKAPGGVVTTAVDPLLDDVALKLQALADPAGGTDADLKLVGKLGRGHRGKRQATQASRPYPSWRSCGWARPYGASAGWSLGYPR